MQKCEGSPSDSIILERRDATNLQLIINKHREEFIEYIERLGLHVEYHDKTQNYQTTSTTIVTLKTRCFKVDFNDNFVTISALK